MDGSQDGQGVHVLSEPAGLMCRLRSIVLVALFASLSATASGSSDVEITPANVVEEMNQYRVEAGLDPLELDPRLSRAAEDRIVDMAEVGYWGHESPLGTSPFVWLARHGYVHWIAGENLAAGYETTPILVESWMESPGHRANILSTDFADVGVALIDGGTTRRLVGRSVVVVFASELETKSGSRD